MWKLNTPGRTSLFQSATKAIKVAITERKELIERVKANEYKQGESNYPTWEVEHLLEDDTAKAVNKHCSSYDTTIRYRFETNVYDLRQENGMTDESHPKPE